MSIPPRDRSRHPGLRATTPQDEAIPGLSSKACAIAQADAPHGGLSLWQDLASARSWFIAAGRERVRTTCGTDATLEWFDTAILTPGKLAASQPAVPGL